jgi:hypothetical protein
LPPLKKHWHERKPNGLKQIETYKAPAANSYGGLIFMVQFVNQLKYLPIAIGIRDQKLQQYTRMKRTVLFALLIFAGLNLISCGPTPQALTYQDVKNFRLFSLSLTPDVGMDIQFYNPNNFSLTLKDADINVLINEREIGRTTITNSFNVPATDTFLLPVKIKANLGNIFANAYSILSNKEVDVRLVGNVKAGKGIYLNIPINYRGRQRLNVLGMR